MPQSNYSGTSTTPALFKGIELCCPLCRGDLVREGRDQEGKFVCAACRRDYPILAGIPDLRVFPDPYIDLEADRTKGLALAREFHRFDFRGFIDHYYRHTSVVPAHHAELYKRGLLSGAARSEQALAAWEESRPVRKGEARSLLEIGCGTGPGLIAAASRYRKVVGIDIAFRWLVVARKRLEEAGRDLPLLCACAEALPFRDLTFDTVLAESVIEHVRDQRECLAECRRVLRPDSRLYVATPNRTSLGPDPHTGMWAAGMLPQSWVARRVRRQGGLPPQRNLLDFKALAAALLKAGFRMPQIWPAAIPAEQRNLTSAPMRLLIDFYMAIRRMPSGRRLLLRAGPLLYAVAEKQGSA